VRTKRILRDGDGGQQIDGPCIGEGGKGIALNDNDDLAIALLSCEWLVLQRIKILLSSLQICDAIVSLSAARNEPRYASASETRGEIGTKIT
jgi:hypothetical protein